MFLVDFEMPLSHASLDAVRAVIDDHVKSSLEAAPIAANGILSSAPRSIELWVARQRSAHVHHVDVAMPGLANHRGMGNVRRLILDFA
jgi:hypothetical protein